MKLNTTLTAAAALALAATGALASGLADSYSAARTIVAAAPKAAVCYARHDDREADEVGLPTFLCFAAGQKVFTAKPKAVFTNSYSEGACSDSVWGSVEVSVVENGLRVVAQIESTNDSCHSSPQSRTLEYAKR